MTTEQLNIIITAQTTDFQEKLAAVNEALKETVSLAQQAASAAAITGAEIPSGTAEVTEMTANAAGTPSSQTGIPSVPVHRGATDISDMGKPSGYADLEEFAASVPELGKSQTLVGAFGAFADSGSGGQTAPIEIHTTVELDGDRLGEAIAAYNERVNRITDGFSDGA